MLSRQEWNETAERAAAARYGEKHAGWYEFRRFMNGGGGLALGVIGAGLGLWWIVSHAWSWVAGAGGGPHGHVPAGYWFVVGASGLVTILAVRPRLLPMSGARKLIQGIVLALLWLGLLSYGLSFL